MTKDEIDTLIDQYCSKYAETGKPIQTNFRQLVPELNMSERYTHLIHSYPAKLLSNIPYFFLQKGYLLSNLHDNFFRANPGGRKRI